MKNSLPFLVSLLLLVVNATRGQEVKKEHTRPNILFIYSDDHTFQAVSAYKSFLSGVIETPNIDRLAAEGMLFENAFCTNSICSPARASVLTGKYSHKNGVKTIYDEFDGGQLTFPKLLQKAGYYTGILGKWHLKSQPTGFDYYNVLNGQGSYFNPTMSGSGNPWWIVPGGDPGRFVWEVEAGKPGGVNPEGLTKHKGYATDIITDLTLDFLKDRPKDKPFLLMYHHKAPHDWFEYDPKHASLLEHQEIPEPDNLFDVYNDRGEAIKRATQKLYFEHDTDQSDNSDPILLDTRIVKENRIMGEFLNLDQLYNVLHRNKSDEFLPLLETEKSIALRNQKVPSLAGSEWNVTLDSEPYTIQFKTGNSFVVSGGTVGIEMTSSYKQQGAQVTLGIGEMSLNGEYDGKEFKLVTNMAEDNFSAREIKKIAYQMYLKAYLRCVASIDENIGRVLKYLDDEGLSENTIVVYTSDQGMFLGEHGLFDKRFMYEESLRVPLLIRYPKEIKPGSVSSDFALNVDFAPTFLDYAGIEIPGAMDGQSLRPILNGKTPDNWRTDMYYRYWMHRGNFNLAAHYGVRSKRLKLIFYYGRQLDANGGYEGATIPEWELFDLQEDPAEMTNVYSDLAYKKDVKVLKERLIQLKKQYEDTDDKYPGMAAVIQRYW